MAHIRSEGILNTKPGSKPVCAENGAARQKFSSSRLARGAAALLDDSTIRLRVSKEKFPLTSDARGTRTQTTYEEYQVQRYEGASTLYGPHTLGAYLDAFRQLTSALVSDQPISPGPMPDRKSVV